MRFIVFVPQQKPLHESIIFAPGHQRLDFGLLEGLFPSSIKSGFDHRKELVLSGHLHHVNLVQPGLFWGWLSINLAPRRKSIQDVIALLRDGTCHAKGLMVGLHRLSLSSRPLGMDLLLVLQDARFSCFTGSGLVLISCLQHSVLQLSKQRLKQSPQRVVRGQSKFHLAPDPHTLAWDACAAVDG